MKRNIFLLFAQNQKKESPISHNIVISILRYWINYCSGAY